MRIGDSEVQLMEVARFKITFATILSRVVTFVNTQADAWDAKKL